MEPGAYPLLFSDVVRVFTVLACGLGIVLCLVLMAARRDAAGDLRLAHITLSRTAFLKLTALVALFGIPLLAMAAGTYGLFITTASVSQCGSCHPMVLFVNDMKDPASENLAAQHYKNRWIQEEQCFHCHSDYGFQGTMDAKFGGVRHLVLYLTGAYHEPIPLRGTFNNNNCLKCHGPTPKYLAEEMHADNEAEIASSETNCITCHDSPHPSADERTPGNPVYIRLMKGAS